jgi:hypothetical protein
MNTKRNRWREAGQGDTEMEERCLRRRMKKRIDGLNHGTARKAKDMNEK